MTTLVITGGTGMLGRQLRTAHAANYAFVSLGRQQLASLPGGSVPGFADHMRIIDALERVEPAGIIHAAAHYVADAKAADIPLMSEASISLTVALSTFALQRDIPFVACTSRFVGNSNLPPLNDYGYFKSIQEQLLQASGLRGMRGALLEIGDMYGPGSRRPRLLNDLIDKLSSKKTVSIRNPSNLLYPIHVSDAARAVLSLLNHVSTDIPLFSVSGQESPKTVGETASQLETLVDSTEKLCTVVHDQQRKIDVRINEYLPRGLPPDGWAPRVTLRETLLKASQGS